MVQVKIRSFTFRSNHSYIGKNGSNIDKTIQFKYRSNGINIGIGNIIQVRSNRESIDPMVQVLVLVLVLVI